MQDPMTTLAAPAAARSPRPRRSWRSALLAGVLASSCTVTACGDGETSIAPPDGEECTLGTAVLNGQVEGTFGEAGCAVESEARGRPRLAQSWTLEAEADRMYIVRLNPVGTTPGMDVMAMTRGPGGEPRYTSLGIYTYQETGEGVNDTRSTELLLPSDRAQEISLRVESDDADGAPSYVLNVTSCPIQRLELGVTRDSIAISGDCQLRAYPFADAPVNVAVLSFRPDSTEAHKVRAERQVGTTLIRGLVAGPGLDLTWTHTPNLALLIGAGEILGATFDVDPLGTYTFIVAAPVGSPLAFAAQANTASAPAHHP